MILKIITTTLGTLCIFWAATSISFAANYYISPHGNDTNTGISEGTAIRSFDKAWSLMVSGDTLIVLNGTYKDSISPKDSNITILAKEDGKAIIDGEMRRVPVKLSGPGDNNITIEGLVLKNGNNDSNWGDDVISIDGGAHHNILRRISAYNAYSYNDSNIIVINKSHYNTIEDCIVYGTGRKGIRMYDGSTYNKINRCFIYWTDWAQNQNCGDPVQASPNDNQYVTGNFPWGESLDIYNSSHNEASEIVAVARVPLAHFTIRSNNNNAQANNNSIKRSIAIGAGLEENGSVSNWNMPSKCQGLINDRDVMNRPTFRTAIEMFKQNSGEYLNNLIEDVIAVHSAGLGLSITLNNTDTSRFSGNNLSRLTVVGNSIDNNDKSADALEVRQSGYNGYNNEHGFNETGVNLNDSYIDRALTLKSDQSYSTRKITGSGAKNLGSLLSFPMENRARSELGISVVETVRPFINYNPQSNSLPPFKIVRTSSPTVIPTLNPTSTPLPPTSTPTAGPTMTPSPTPSPKQGEIIPVTVLASANTQDINPAGQAIDKNLATRWSAEGVGQWIQFDLGSIQHIGSIQIAWYRGDTRSSTIDVLGSTDGQTWNTIQSQVASSGTASGFETYQFLTTQLRYLRIIGYGNTESAWNSINEVEIYQGTLNTNYDPKFDLNEDGSVNIMDILQFIKFTFSP